MHRTDKQFTKAQLQLLYIQLIPSVLLQQDKPVSEHQQDINQQNYLISKKMKSDHKPDLSQIKIIQQLKTREKAREFRT